LNVEWINPFIRAANHVLNETVSFDHAKLGQLQVDEAPYTTQDVTCMLGVSGVLSGSVFLGMSEEVAGVIIERMVGETLPVSDPLGESALGEVVNMISGSALRFLESAGYTCAITPPVVIRGRGATITTAAKKRVVVPMQYDQAMMHLAVSLQQG